MREIAFELVSSAENSSLDWRAQYAYIEDIGDGRGYTAGIIGFCSGTGDMLELVQAYTETEPDNPLAAVPARARGRRTAPTRTRGSTPGSWRRGPTAAEDPVFQAAQDTERDDRVLRSRRSRRRKADGLQALGQFAYYDAAVMHGFDGHARDPGCRAGHRGTPGRRRGRDRVPVGVPRRARDRDEQGGGPLRHHARQHRRSACSSTRATSPCSRRCAGRCTATRTRSTPCRLPVE